MANELRNILEIFLISYAVIKYGFKKILPIGNNKNLNILLELVYIVFALLLYAIIVLIVTPFVIIRQTLDIYLRHKYGEKYGGLLKYVDAMWMAESEGSKHIVHGFMIIQLRDSPEEFLEYFKGKFKHSQRVQFNTTLHNILNYWYKLKSAEVVERAIRIIDLSEDERRYKDKFQEKLSRLSNTSLPKCIPYEFLLSSQPVLFLNNGNSGDSNHVIIMRFHHSISDGRHFLHFLEHDVFERETVPEEVKITHIDKKCNMSSKQCNYLKEIKNILEHIKKTPDILKNCFLYHISLIEFSDDNILHGPKLSGEKVFIFHTEDKPDYVSKIKAIKRRFDDCRFSDVLYTALSASLWKYFQEHDEKNIPKDVYITFTTSSIKELNHIHDLDYMNSKFFCAALNLPIKINETNTESGNLTSRLQIIMARSKLQRKSLDLLALYWFIRHFYFLPTSLAKYIFSAYIKSTAVLSNLPGIEAVSINGQKLKDLVIWIPNVAKMGVSILVMSYDSRLPVTLVADKKLIPSRKEASAILKNFYENLDLLEEEINSNM